jgi:CcmD family protein
MEMFVAAYLVVWLAVVLYVARLGVHQRRLLHTVKTLQLELERSTEEPEHPESMAA